MIAFQIDAEGRYFIIFMSVEDSDSVKVYIDFIRTHTTQRDTRSPYLNYEEDAQKSHNKIYNGTR